MYQPSCERCNRLKRNLSWTGPGAVSPEIAMLANRYIRQPSRYKYGMCRRDCSSLRVVRTHKCSVRTTYTHAQTWRHDVVHRYKHVKTIIGALAIAVQSTRTGYETSAQIEHHQVGCCQRQLRHDRQPTPCLRLIDRVHVSKL